MLVHFQSLEAMSEGGTNVVVWSAIAEWTAEMTTNASVCIEA